MNISKIRFFTGSELQELELEVNTFMLQCNKIYNVKHNITTEDGFQDMHYIMVSYE